LVRAGHGGDETFVRRDDVVLVVRLLCWIVGFNSGSRTRDIIIKKGTIVEIGRTRIKGTEARTDLSRHGTGLGKGRERGRRFFYEVVRVGATL
jgi:hypothetical protein